MVGDESDRLEKLQEARAPDDMYRRVEEDDNDKPKKGKVIHQCERERENGNTTWKSSQSANRKGQWI